MTTTAIVQGRYFSIDREKLGTIIEAVAIAIGVERQFVRGERVQDNLIDYDWANADEHQTWLDSAPVAEIVSWLQTLD